MNALEEQYKWLSAQQVTNRNSSHSWQAYVYLKHEGDKVISFERAGLFWVFNFHPNQSFVDYKFGVPRAGKYPLHTLILRSLTL